MRARTREGTNSASPWTGTRVPRNTGFPLMILPFNRSLVGARVERISSARAPEMCPFSKTIRENQTVRETFQGLSCAMTIAVTLCLDTEAAAQVESLCATLADRGISD